MNLDVDPATAEVVKNWLMGALQALNEAGHTRKEGALILLAVSLGMSVSAGATTDNLSAVFAGALSEPDVSKAIEKNDEGKT